MKLSHSWSILKSKSYFRFISGHDSWQYPFRHILWHEIYWRLSLSQCDISNLILGHHLVAVITHWLKAQSFSFKNQFRSTRIFSNSAEKRIDYLTLNRTVFARAFLDPCWILFRNNLKFVWTICLFSNPLWAGLVYTVNIYRKRIWFVKVYRYCKNEVVNWAAQ